MAKSSVRVYLDPERLTPEIVQSLRGCLSENQHRRTLTSEQARHMRAVMAANKGVEAQRKRGIWNFQKKRADKPTQEAETAGREAAEPAQAVRAQETPADAGEAAFEREFYEQSRSEPARPTSANPTTVVPGRGMPVSSTEVQRVLATIVDRNYRGLRRP